MQDICELSYSMLIQDLTSFKYNGKSLSAFVSEDWTLRVSPIIKNYINQMPPRDCRIFMHNLDQRLGLYVNQLIAEL